MTTARPYHHGDLRAALLTAARAKLADKGYEALSLRELAREIGVARNAPYAHFASREALLLELIADGARELMQHFEVAAQAAKAPEDRLADACRAYLVYARANPELFRLMFISPPSAAAAALPQADAALRLFERVVADVLEAKAPAPAPPQTIRETAVACFSAMHGFAMLHLHGRLAHDLDVDKIGEAVIAAAVRQAHSAAG